MWTPCRVHVYLLFDGLMVSRVSDFIPGVLLHQDHSTILAYVVKVVMALIALEQQSLHYFLCYYMSSTYYVQLL